MMFSWQQISRQPKALIYLEYRTTRNLLTTLQLHVKLFVKDTPLEPLHLDTNKPKLSKILCIETVFSAKLRMVAKDQTKLDLRLCDMNGLGEWCLRCWLWPFLALDFKPKLNYWFGASAINLLVLWLGVSSLPSSKALQGIFLINCPDKKTREEASIQIIQGLQQALLVLEPRIKFCPFSSEYFSKASSAKRWSNCASRMATCHVSWLHEESRTQATGPSSISMVAMIVCFPAVFVWFPVNRWSLSAKTNGLKYASIVPSFVSGIAGRC